MLSLTLHANFRIYIVKQRSSLDSLTAPFLFSFVRLCRIQANWKSLRSKTVSLDQGNEIIPFLWSITIHVANTQIPQYFLFFLVYVARKRRLLQTHVLWHRVTPVYGDDPQPCLCEQVCLLLEVISSSLKQQQHARQNFTQNKPSETSVKEVGPLYV